MENLFKRKIYDQLVKWKTTRNGATAMLIEGAPGVGKTTIVKEFGKNEYKSMLYIDFKSASEKVKDAFYEHSHELDILLMILSVEYGVKLYPRASLVVFDNVHHFTRARQLIKHLVADGRYDYIEIGFTINIYENVKDILIPSEENSMEMFPMDFEEFCWALGYNVFIDFIHEHFQNQTPLYEYEHEKAMLLFNQYMLIGGMPSSVKKFIDNNWNIFTIEEEKQKLLSIYKREIGSFAKNYHHKMLSLFNQIPTFLSSKDKRVHFSSIKKGENYTHLFRTFDWLEDSNMVIESYSCVNFKTYMNKNENPTMIKCYLGDTGLLISHLLSEKNISEEQLYQEILNNNLSIYHGMLLENMVAQMLTCNHHKLYFYTHYNEKSHRNDISIDILLSNGLLLKHKVIPIVIKTTNRYSFTSLERFIKKYAKNIAQAYVIHPKNLMKKDEILCIPPYMTICL